MILAEIIRNKKTEISRRKETLPLSSFRRSIKKSERSFRNAISKGLNLIAEVKRASPSEGVIRNNLSIRKIIKIYDQYADAISVLTDRKFFSGSMNDLKRVRKLTNKPILCKDFIIDPYQIYEARYYGADAILLIAAILSKKEIDDFIKIAKRYGMDCIVEVHTASELRKVLSTKAEIIGINNRNLDTLKVDLNTTLKLADKIPKGKIIVSESGYTNKEDIIKIRNKANAVLIGTSLLKSKSIEKKIRELFFPKVKICGITTEEDALAAEELGADYIGLIFYEKSPRHVKPAVARKIASRLVHAKTVGVFVNQSLREIKKTAKECNLDLIQLHGNETPAFCKKVEKATNRKVIKAIRIKNKKDVERAKCYDVEFVLFDTFQRGKFGGVGKTFNHCLIKNYKKNYFLSGGLNPHNIAKALKELRPYGIDVNSGVEKLLGKKDISKLRLLFERLR
jgi:indole-3-glycerol phosphate synthase